MSRAPTPSVAVLLSTFNGERFLVEQLDSLKAQKGVAVILHARDDGSSDSSREVLARYSDRWAALAHAPAGPNLGPAASFLELLLTAPEADYYAFCDQDDVWLPEKLAHAVAALAGDTGPALYCSNVSCVAEDLRVLGRLPANGDTRLQHLLFENIATGCTVVMNAAARALIASRMPGRGVVMHDWWCALVIAALGRVCYDPEPHVLYRQHGKNVLGRKAAPLRQMLDNAARFLREPARFYPIHAQAADLLRCWGDLMAAQTRDTVVRLVESRASLGARVRYAAGRHILRRSRPDQLVVKMLILANKY
jgi:glycosyltransferase involved in cell wall biosynthesis